MPRVSFDQLPDDARVWVFAAAASLDAHAREVLLRDVDAHLSTWQAHGAPLTCAREWREDRFLAIGVDQSTEGASGCSIDGLYRVLQEVGRSIGVSLLPGARVFYRQGDGTIACVDRPTLAQRRRAGEVGETTPVFDTTLTDAGSYRARFERPLGESWHARLVR